MNKIKSIVLLCLFLMLTCISCKKDPLKDFDYSDPDNWVLPPNVFFFQILKDGNRLPDAVLSKLQFYYYDENNNKISRASELLDNPEHYAMFDTLGEWAIYNQAGILGSGHFPLMTDKYHTWYLEYPDGDIDTLVGISKMVSTKEGRNEECKCNNPLVYLSFNGKEVKKHESLRPYDKPVYILEK